MAYREVAMWEVLHVLRRIGRGESQAAVARLTGHGRKTVRRYVAVAAELGWQPGTVEPTEALAAEVCRRLRLTKVHQLLARLGVEVPYSSLHRFAVKHCGFSERPWITVRMAECAPSELAEVDFRQLGLVPNAETGRRRTLRTLLVVLGHSRHQYVHVTPSQKLPAVIRGLEEAWAFFGEVPRRVVLDNLKAAVTKADRYDPVFQGTFEEYACWRGFVIDPTRAQHATGTACASYCTS